MSYDIELTDPISGEVLHTEIPHHLAGGTYCQAGTTKLWLNVTYNYAHHFIRVLGEGGIRVLYGKSGAEALPLLNRAIAALNNDVDSDYWKPTEGNAKAALLKLRAMALLRPDGVFAGD
jgi:hypothetical protein